MIERVTFHVKQTHVPVPANELLFAEGSSELQTALDHLQFGAQVPTSCVHELAASSSDMTHLRSRGDMRASGFFPVFVTLFRSLL